MSLSQIGLFVGIPASVLTLLGFLYKFREKVLQILLIRRFVWWWNNQKIRVKITTSRKYPYFDFQIKHIEEKIKQIVKEMNGRFNSSPISGENYIIFGVEKMTAPIKLGFLSKY